MSGDANFQLWKVEFLARFKRLPNLFDAWQAGREFGHGDAQMRPRNPELDRVVKKLHGGPEFRVSAVAQTLQRTAAERVAQRRYEDVWNTKSPDSI